ncbi:MAG: hypothetical protein J0G94_16060 [Sphingomonadales bacterium]|nr:hypothetical protein [Sphingomonadales bacterium]
MLNLSAAIRPRLPARKAIDPLPKAIFVGTGGNITLRAADGSADVVFKNVASGQILDVRARFIRATGTTAADIVGLA